MVCQINNYPHEALVFVYRGLEWLVEGMGFTWEGIAKELGGTKNDIRELKKTANVETGVRHASKSGMKLRASPENYGTWVAGLFDIIKCSPRDSGARICQCGRQGGSEVVIPCNSTRALRIAWSPFSFRMSCREIRRWKRSSLDRIGPLKRRSRPFGSECRSAWARVGNDRQADAKYVG